VLTAAVYPDVIMPHAVKGCRGQRGLREYQTAKIDAELTGSATARILGERRSTSVLLPPATRAIRTGSGIGLGGATMSMHDAM
jgi:hypothetical protein